MTTAEWLKEYRMIGNTLITQGKWAVEVLEDKARNKTLVKDRVKEGIPSIIEDEMTGAVQVYIEKSPKYLANTIFYEQVETLLELYDQAIVNTGADVILLPWYECSRVKVKKENAYSILQATTYHLDRVKPEYKAEWSKVIPKEMAFFHEKIMEGVCSTLEYMQEKHNEISAGDNKRAIRDTKPAASEW